MPDELGRGHPRSKPQAPRTPRRKPRLLSLAEVGSLAREFRRTVAYLEGRRRVEPMASLIQYPKLPEALTESLAALLLTTGLIALPGYGPVTAVSRGGPEADLIVMVGDTRLRVEVKGTQAGLTAFNPNDLTADFLVWLDLDRHFVDGGPARVIVVPTAGQLGYTAAKRLTTATLRRDHAGAISDQLVSLASLGLGRKG